jgi:hypothetical protein
MITDRSLYFFSFIVVFLVSILGTGAYFYLRYRYREQYPYGKWEDLLGRLGPLDHDNLALIAGDQALASDPEAIGAEELDAQTIWRLLGGMHGLEMVERNCAVLVDLVFYVQQWYPEALLVTEQLRLHAHEVEWNIDRLRAAAKTGKRKRAATDHLQQAVAVYYRMTCEVLSLYEQADLPGLTELRRAL